MDGKREFSEEMQKLFDDVNNRKIELPKSHAVNVCMSETEDDVREVFVQVSKALMNLGYKVLVVTDLEKHETNLFGYK